MSGYQALADYYDLLMATDYNALADHLLALFARHGCQPQTLLDLACGSGSLTVALQQRGMDMIGVDGSEDMLSIAREKNPDVFWLCQDMRELDLYDVVDGAVCTLDSINHLLKTADIAAVFERLRLFVAPGGLFIFDVNTPYKHRVTLADNTYVFEEDGLMCVWQNRLQAKTDTVHMFLDFFEEDDDGRYNRMSDEVRERAYSLATLKHLLADAQFEVLAVYEDMTTNAPSPTAERWMIVAQNRRPQHEFVTE